MKTDREKFNYEENLFNNALKRYQKKNGERLVLIEILKQLVKERDEEIKWLKQQIKTNVNG